MKIDWKIVCSALSLCIRNPNALHDLLRSGSYNPKSAFRNLQSLNHLVRPRQHVRRNRETDLLGGFEIDEQLEFSRLLHRKIGGFGALKDFIDVSGGAPMHVQKVRRIACEATLFNIVSPGINGGNPVL